MRQAPARPEDTGGAAGGEPGGGRDGTGGGSPARGWARRAAGWAVTVSAAALVLVVLNAPTEAGRFTAGAMVRIPLEGVLGAGLLLVLPARARRAAAFVMGVAAGLLGIVKIIDVGFYNVLARPFNVLFDWPFFGNALDFLTASFGRAGAYGCAAMAVVVAVAVPVAVTRSVLRLARLAASRRKAVGGALTALGAGWVVCALLGARLVPGVPVAALAYDRLLQVRTSLQDEEAFAVAERVDAFAGTPGDRLLTALRGKDVVFAFVESYGRDAVEDPMFTPQVGAVLDAGTARLKAKGFGARSAFLTSPTFGGGSWLAHGTLLSGLWVSDQKRYDDLVSGDRLTLTGAFRKAGWRTVAVMPGNTGGWPEAPFFGYDKVYDQRNLGYRGPRFNWGTEPDQYTLSAFQRLERARPGHRPLMAEIPLVSSHSPWAPTPRTIPWDAVGDGTAYRGMPAQGHTVDEVWSDAERVRVAYRGSIEYSLSSLISYVETYGGDDLVLVFLGDHQPAPLVTGPGASRDVPITIVAHDRAVLDAISGWGWQDGLRPGPTAPVWPMNAFRDRFLTAFGPAVSRPAPEKAAGPASPPVAADAPRARPARGS